MRIEEAARAFPLVAVLFVFPLALPAHAEQLHANGPFSQASIANALREPHSDNPVVIHHEYAHYTPDAMRHKIQGVVVVEAEVKTDGTVGAVKIVRSLDKTYGLDDAAVRAAKGWRFKPVIKNGKPASATVTIELAFACNCAVRQLGAR